MERAEPTEILVGTRTGFADDGRRIVTVGVFQICVLQAGWL
jgi:hypothetical protein